jgi:hypothetical protein
MRWDIRLRSTWYAYGAKTREAPRGRRRLVVEDEDPETANPDHDEADPPADTGSAPGRVPSTGQILTARPAKPLAIAKPARTASSVSAKRLARVRSTSLTEPATTT